MELDDLAKRIASTPAKGRRKLVALAGPPASGKSTMAEALSAQIEDSCVVPMDGFHLNNDILTAQGLLDRKGAPSTFDALGFVGLVSRLATEADVSYPLFDRELDCAVPDAGRVDSSSGTVIVEGNYLLLDQPIWRNLNAYWDVTIQISVSLPTLKTRLLNRWADLGYSDEDALRKTESNDLPNAQTVLECSIPAQITLTSNAA